MTSHNNILIAYKSVCIYYFKSEIFLLEIPPKLKIEGDERRKKKKKHIVVKSIDSLLRLESNTF